MNPGVGKTNENDYEKYFRWYCEDLIEHGYLKSVHREYETFQVMPQYIYKREKHFVRKDNEIERFNLAQNITYTYDALLVWTEKGLNVFYEIMYKNGHFVFGEPTFVAHYKEINGKEEVVSYVDVKPHSAAAMFGGGKNASYYTFPFVQKLLLYKYDLYVNKIVPIPSGKHGKTSCLFAKTFTPKRYYFTDVSLANRKLTHRPINSLKSYTQDRIRIIENLKQQEYKKNENKSSQSKMDL